MVGGEKSSYLTGHTGVTISNTDKTVASATYSNGWFTVKGLKIGNCTVVRRSYSKTSDTYYTYTYNVKVVDVTSVTIPSTLSLTLGEVYTFSPVIALEGATANLTWMNSNSSVATIDKNGKVTTKGVGTTTITCVAQNGVQATCQLTVNPIEVSSVVLNETSSTLKIGGTVQLYATVSPSNATNKTVTWNSSDPSVATVSNSGLVTAKDLGTATITCTASNGVVGTCEITVNPVLVTSISLNHYSYTLNIGKTIQLSASVSPSNATNNAIEWSSSDVNVAIVSSSGLVTAVAEGTCTIYVKATDGSNISEHCSITVKKINMLSVIAATSSRGATIKIPVSLRNEDNIAGLQFDLVLPDGITLNDAAVTSRTANHTITKNMLSTGAVRFMLTSLSNELISGSDGAVLNLYVSADKDIEPGEYPYGLSNIQLTARNGSTNKTITQGDVTSKIIVGNVMLGDVNGDDLVNVTDVVAIISHVLEDTPEWFIYEAADIDGDGLINVTDVVNTIQIALEEE